jgi:hypothetical protein
VCARGCHHALLRGPSTSPLDSVHKLLRTALAFALSPALGVVAASLVLALITQRSVQIGFAASLLPIAYLVAGVIGVPAYLLSRAWLPVQYGLTRLLGSLLPVWSQSPSWLSSARLLGGSLLSSQERLLDSHLGRFWARNLTIVGGARELWSVWRRGRWKRLCARGADRALLRGPSTSPLGINSALSGVIAR